MKLKEYFFQVQYCSTAGQEGYGTRAEQGRARAGKEEQGAPVSFSLMTRGRPAGPTPYREALEAPLGEARRAGPSGAGLAGPGRAARLSG